MNIMAVNGDGHKAVATSNHATSPAVVFDGVRMPLSTAHDPKLAAQAQAALRRAERVEFDLRPVVTTGWSPAVIDYVLNDLRQAVADGRPDLAGALATAIDAAEEVYWTPLLAYEEREFAIAPMTPGGKKPAGANWSAAGVPLDRFRLGQPVGIVLGPVSGRPGHAAVCLDIDARAALELADRYLPPTAMSEGRPGKPDSHRFFDVPFDSIPEQHWSKAERAAPFAAKHYGHPGPRKRQFRGPAGEVLIDFLGTGSVVVCPPSVHPSGEVRSWAGGEPGEPAVVRFPELWEATNRLAIACGWVPPTSRTRRPDMNLLPWGSYEGWSGLVRSAVVWAGMPDPGESRATRRGNRTSEEVAVRTIVARWRTLPVPAVLAVSELVTNTFPKDPFDRPMQPTDVDVADALKTLSPQLSVKAIGTIFGKYKNRPLDGRRLVHAGTTGGSARWTVENVTPAGSGP